MRSRKVRKQFDIINFHYKTFRDTKAHQYKKDVCAAACKHFLAVTARVRNVKEYEIFNGRLRAITHFELISHVIISLGVSFAHMMYPQLNIMYIGKECHFS